MRISRHAFANVLAPLLCALCCACVSASSEPDAAASSAAELARPWPTDFQVSAVLVANEVSVEGPPGLLAHFALRVDPEFHDRSEETTRDGYLQMVSTKPDSPFEIRAYLDLLEIAALSRITVLERPGNVDVTVRARGEVYYARTQTGEEQRVQSLELVAKQPPFGGASR